MRASAISALLTSDHRTCDGLLAAVEGAVTAREWQAAATAWSAFELAMRGHLQAEEQVLFPAFEQATGNRGGPTTVMRMEHDQMRALFDSLGEAVSQRDERRLLDLSDTLMVLVQQHNMKEEQVLYPLCDEVVAHLAGELEKRIAAAGTSTR